MRKRGLVWNHFAPLEEEKAKCIVCPAVISYKRGSTSNLLRHMKKKHPDIDVHDEDPMKVENGGETMASEDEDEEDGISVCPSGLIIFLLFRLVWTLKACANSLETG